MFGSLPFDVVQEINLRFTGEGSLVEVAGGAFVRQVFRA